MNASTQQINDRYIQHKDPIGNIRQTIMRTHRLHQTAQRATSARSAVVRVQRSSVAVRSMSQAQSVRGQSKFQKLASKPFFGLCIPMNLRSSETPCLWTTGNGYEDAPPPGEVSV